MNLHRKIMILGLLLCTVFAFGQKYSTGKVPTNDRSRIKPTTALAKGTKPNQVLMTLGDSTLKYVDADTASTIFGTELGWGKEGNSGVSRHINFIGTTDTGSFVIKANNIKLGDFSGYNKGIAIGQNTTASGQNSVAIGWSTTSSGLGSVAIGEGNSVSGSYATGFGTNAIASGHASCSFGNTNVSSGYGSIAMGQETESYGYASGSIGYLSKAVGKASFSAGYQTVGSGMGSAVFGTFNDIDTPADSNGINVANRLFQIGNGTGISGNRSNALTVLQSGNIGIGTVLPLYKLEITGNLAVGGFEKIIATFPTDGTGVDNGSIFKATTGALYYKSDGGTVTLIAPN